MTVKIEDIEAKKEILSSEFHQYYFITLDKELSLASNQHVNVVIPFEKISNSETNYGLNHLMSYFNDNFTNILITNADNSNIIHKFECYQNVLFIRLQPYTKQIALHILPKIYNTSDNILFLKDNKKFKLNITNHYSRHNDKQHKNINLYFQDTEGDRDPKTKPYPEFDKFDDSPFIYYRYNTQGEGEEATYTWKKDRYQNTYGEFEYDLRKYNKDNTNNIQINTGYKYNDSSPTNAVHYTGIKDITNQNPADRCCLIDANFDNITDNSNVIEQFELDANDNVIFPTTASPINDGFTHNSGLHSANIGKLYHKTIKYYNDEMYSEEFDGNNVKYMINEWHDLDTD